MHTSLDRGVPGKAVLWSVILEPMYQALVPIGVALVAGLFGVLGVLLSRRFEHERWLRQERLHAIARLLSAAQEAYFDTDAKLPWRRRPRRIADVEAVSVETNEKGVEGSLAEREVGLAWIERLSAELINAHSTLTLLAPSLNRESDGVFRAFNVVLKEGSEDARTGLMDAFSAFRDAASRSLGVGGYGR